MEVVKKPSLLLFLSIFLMVFSSGCYTTGSLLPGHLKTIYVDNFKNKIDIGKEVTETARYKLYRPGLENDVTNAVVERFVFDGNLRIANTEEEADAILKGNLIDYRQDPLRYDADDNVEEYRILVTVDMEFVDVANNKVLWKEKSFTGEETYMTTGRFVTSEDTARVAAIDDLARRIVERTVENW